MFPGKKLLPLSLPLVILFMNICTAADWKEETAGIKVSGGEDHTLVLTKDNHAWASGPNGDYQLGIGSDISDQLTLVRIHDGDMNTPSGYLEDINDLGDGWIYLVFNEQPFGRLRIRPGYGGIKGLPTIRATCAFALNFRATPKSKIP